MLPPEPRVAGVRKLIDDQLYFVVHAPRQAGKTTSLQAMARSLTAGGTYAALHTSCETGQLIQPNLEASMDGILAALQLNAARELADELRPPPSDPTQPVTARLLDLLTRWAEQCPRPVVLFLDEIDALFDDALISVLRQVRSGFPSRPQSFPHAVVLIGLRDIRDYKMIARGESSTLGTASPFNIKSDSLRLPDFNAKEVAALYEQHTADTGQVFSDDVKAMAFELTQGQPWLVNALARQLVETVVRDRRREITPEHLRVAKEILIRRRDTHLDSLLDRLREERVRRVLEPVLAGEIPEEDVFNDDYQFVKDLGLVRLGEGGLEIANAIYNEIIPRALTSSSETYVPMRRASYVEDDGRLDWPVLLDGFTAFWRQNAEWMLRRQPYSEAAAQLVFMAFLHRLVNGVDLDPQQMDPSITVASVDREFAVGSGRIDLMVRWPVPGGPPQRFAVELKVRRDKAADPLEQGLQQLGDYLDRLGLDTGTLILFDLRTEAPPMNERCGREILEHGGRSVTVLRLREPSPEPRTVTRDLPRRAQGVNTLGVGVGWISHRPPRSRRSML